MNRLPWTSKLPATWSIKTGRQVLEPVNRLARPQDEVVTAFRDGEVTLRRNRRTEGFTEAMLEHGYQGIRDGDLAVHSMDGFAGAVGVSDSDGKVSPVLHLYRARDGNERFVAYVLREAARAGYVSALGKGIRERSTAFDTKTLAQMGLPWPSRIAQQRIADYLDSETATIDTLIEKQRRLIALVQERRTRIIDQQLVGWSMLPLGRDVELVTSGPRGWGQFYAEDGRRFLRIADLTRGSYLVSDTKPQYVEAPSNAESVRATTRRNDLLFSITAYLGSVALVDSNHAGAAISQHLGLVRLSGRIWSPHFVAYAVLSRRGQQQLKLSSYGGTKVQVALDDLRSFEAPVPPLDEQRRIADHLDEETAKMDALIAKAERFIELARERRAALITAAVTGQISVD